MQIPAFQSVKILFLLDTLTNITRDIAQTPQKVIDNLTAMLELTLRATFRTALRATCSGQAFL